MSRILALILAVTCISSAYTAKFASVATNYCNSVDSNGFCDGCYTHNGAKIMAKMWNVTGVASATRVCTAAHFFTVVNAKQMASAAFGTTTNVSNMTVARCASGYRITSLKDETAGTYAITCVKEANTIVNCNDGSEIKNTELINTVSTVTTACFQCKKGFMPGTWNTDAGFTSTVKTCVTATAIANCEWYYKASSTIAVSCAQCKSGYAVAYTTAATNSIGSCVANAVKNCGGNNNLSTAVAATDCQRCWGDYYHDVANCKLASNLMKIGVVGALALIAALFA